MPHAPILYMQLSELDHKDPPRPPLFFFSPITCLDLVKDRPNFLSNGIILKSTPQKIIISK